MISGVLLRRAIRLFQHQDPLLSVRGNKRTDKWLLGWLTTCGWCVAFVCLLKLLREYPIQSRRVIVCTPRKTMRNRCAPWTRRTCAGGFAHHQGSKWLSGRRRWRGGESRGWDKYPFCRRYWQAHTNQLHQLVVMVGWTMCIFARSQRLVGELSLQYTVGCHNKLKHFLAVVRVRCQWYLLFFSGNFILDFRKHSNWPK